MKVPETWEDNEFASLEWYWQFRYRHPELSLTKPEACSFSRATSFNKYNVDTFLNNLGVILHIYPELADATRILMRLLY